MNDEPSASTEAAEVEAVEEWVCVGMRRDDKTLYHAWAPLPFDAENNIRLYKKKLVSFAKVGGVFQLHVVRRGTSAAIRMGGDKAPKYLRVYDADDAEDKILEWTTISEADVTADRLEKRARKELPIDVIKTAMAPIRRAYGKTDRTGRRAIKALVLEYLET